MIKLGFYLFYWPTMAFRRVAKPVLRRELGTFNAARLWADIQIRKRILKKTRPKHSLGVNFLLRYMELDVALYQACLAKGMTEGEAGGLVQEINWKVFEPVTAVSFSVSRLRSSRLLRRVEWIVDLMFELIFGSPFQRVTHPSTNKVAFDVTVCPLAGYFKSQGVPELTRFAACSLDHRMAMQWGVELKRTTTIAEGAPLCDFRFQPIGADVAQQSVAGDAPPPAGRT